VDTAFCRAGPLLHSSHIGGIVCRFCGAMETALAGWVLSTQVAACVRVGWAPCAEYHLWQ